MIENSHYIDWERCKDIFTDEIDFLPWDNQFVHISMDYNNEWIYIPKNYTVDNRTIVEKYWLTNKYVKKNYYK